MAVNTENIVIDDILTMEDKQKPTEDHSVFTFKVGSDGRPEKGSQGWYTIGELIDDFGEEAVNAKNAAVSAQKAAEAAQSAAESAKNSTKAIYDDAVELKSEYDAKVSEDTTAFNNNYDSKMQAFNNNATAKTNEYNSNHSTKKSDYDNNAQEKLKDYNDNHTSKKNEYDNNASSKLGAYNNNHTEKMAAYDAQASEDMTALNTLKTQTEKARDTAVSARDAAVSAKTAAETARGQAEDAKDAAVSAKTATETARDAAKSAQSAAASSASTASTKASEASSSASAAQSAKTAAESAKTAAEEAETACQKLVESVDAEGLGERMDSIETDMANKSDNGHKHTSADITDLQGKLDAKLDKGANAVSASKWQTARKITVSGDVSGNVSMDGSKDVSLSLAHKTSGVTAGTYGPTAAVTLAFGGSVNVPKVTVDSKGHVTSASHYAIKLPAAPTSVSGNAGTATKLQTKRTITLAGAVAGSAQFDGSANITITVTNERRHWPGEIFAFAGKSNKLPARTLVCNGGAVSRNTYKELFNVIGTTYGAGDGSTTFNLPNLYACKNDDGTTVNNGVFLRAAVNDSQIGQKEQDAIRDITGTVSGASGNNKYLTRGRGCFTYSTKYYSGDNNMGGFGNWDSHYYHIFDANADNNNWGNPMKGHAVGTDIHPYSMRILYLIAY